MGSVDEMGFLSAISRDHQRNRKVSIQRKIDNQKVSIRYIAGPSTQLQVQAPSMTVLTIGVSIRYIAGPSTQPLH